ncbi:hypothetical protein LPJ66_009080, partial [Kickxella alabastrina]
HQQMMMKMMMMPPDMPPGLMYGQMPGAPPPHPHPHMYSAAMPYAGMPTQMSGPPDANVSAGAPQSPSRMFQHQQ